MAYGGFGGGNMQQLMKQAQAMQRKLQEAQEEIANQWAENQIGKTYRVIIDRLEGEYYVGRTEYDSPEVDCEVLIHRNSADLQLGQFYNARITDAEVFDFFAEVVNEEV